jgi:hypothetical protein
MSDNDSQELDFTPVEGEKPVPMGWRILFWGLVAFGAYYLWAYSPALGGWTQTRDLESGGGSGINVFATVVFTALAVIAAVSIVLVLARRGRSTGAGRGGG